jgi:hypothetical protein
VNTTNKEDSMITADTITDDQIRELRGDAPPLPMLRLCAEALATHVPGSTRRHHARARCAEILNARAACGECGFAPIPGRTYDHHAVSCSKRCRHPNAAPARELGGDAMSCPDCGAVYRPRRVAPLEVKRAVEARTPVGQCWKCGAVVTAGELGCIRCGGPTAADLQLIPTVPTPPTPADICRRLSTLAKVRHAIPDFDRAFDELVRDARAAVGEQPTISDGPEPA